MRCFERLRGAILVSGLLLLAGCAGNEENAVAQISDASKNQESAERAEKKKEPKKQTTNRLARESSPYLLLHAHNPVDWYPWGPEAFEAAKREKKLIFLSIGYSSCYWCHVMERLVFSDEKIARTMNKNFINIKVDREERPDVDDIYMTALTVYLQLIGSRQGGGWPLSMFLTPQGKPVVGGTYFPPKDKGGILGFPTVMKRMVDLWDNHHEQALELSETLTAHVRRATKPGLSLKTVELERQLVDEAISALRASYDSEYGGIDFHADRPNSPKFPVPAKLALLQYDIRKNKNQESAKIVYHTLDSLQAGGIRDHLGGGFHRYSTDRKWQVPHFEKMLYDQAQLADVYVEAFRQTGKAVYREVAEGIFTFVSRELTDPLGGFYSALDAETDGVEGKFYVWSKQEVDTILGSDDAGLFNRVYGLAEPQVFEHGYILHLSRSLDTIAKETQQSPAKLKNRLATMRSKMLAARERRKPLMRDDKVLTSWSGLMIRALAHAGLVFKRDDYIAGAKKAADFIVSRMRDKNGNLRRTFRQDQAKLNGYLDDYAFFVDGLLALHEATHEEKWLTEARRLMDEQIKMYWDEQNHAFFFTSHNHEPLIARTKNAYDAVLPSGNGVSVRNLIRLASLTGEASYRKRARQTLEVFAPVCQKMPGSTTSIALALGEFLDEPNIELGN